MVRIEIVRLIEINIFVGFFVVKNNVVEYF